MSYQQIKGKYSIMKIINRISRIFAIVIVYIMCAYTYLSAKGFIFNKGVPVLSNNAVAKEVFAKELSGDLMIGDNILRAKGSKTAPITMYVFSSMVCSHCSDFHKRIYPKIEENFISTGDLRFIFVHLPTDMISMQAAKLSYCLPPNRYYDFIEELYKRKDWIFDKSIDKINKHALRFDFKEADIKTCKDNKKLTSDILLARDNAISKLGITGTPSFVVEFKGKKELITGIHSYKEFEQYFNDKLGKNKSDIR